MTEANLVIAASLHLVGALVSTQDPRISSRQARVLHQVIAASWVELRSDSLTPGIWLAQLERLGDAFEDHDPPNEDLLSLAADHVAGTLESLASGEPDAASAWETTSSAFQVLEEWRGRRPVAPFFSVWLQRVRASLQELTGTRPEADVADAAQDVLDAAIAEAQPYIREAYEVAVLEVDDWEREL